MINHLSASEGQFLSTEDGLEGEHLILSQS